MNYKAFNLSVLAIVTAIASLLFARSPDRLLLGLRAPPFGWSHVAVFEHNEAPLRKASIMFVHNLPRMREISTSSMEDMPKNYLTLRTKRDIRHGVVCASKDNEAGVKVESQT